MPVDIGALQEFSGVFPFLLVLTLVYAFLTNTPWFKDNKGVAGVIAVIAAFMTLFSKIAIKTINLMAPWFVLLVIFMILFMLAFMLFGYKIEDITTYVSGGEFGIGVWVMSVMLIIGIGSLVYVVNEEQGFGQLTESGEPAYDSSEDIGFWQTVFHPKVLGMVLVLLIAFFTIKQLSKSE